MTRTTLTAALMGGASLIALPALAEKGYEPKIDPCNAGFYEADMNADDTITQEELEQAARASFEMIDADQSGEVTAEEYEECGNRTAGTRAMPSDRSEDNFAEYDTNEDGGIDQQEFMTAASEIAGDLPAEGMPSVEMRRFVFLPESMRQEDASGMDAEEVAARAAIMFVVLDADSDRAIGPAEWAKQEAVKTDVADMLSMGFSEADTDQSGTLSVEEYLASQEERRAAAEEMAREAGEGSDAGAPVVYYRYPGVM
jgi:Ca2+-binding EF-hand superfamily protein